MTYFQSKVKKFPFIFGLSFLILFVLNLEAHPFSLQISANNLYDFWEGSDLPIHYMINTSTIPPDLVVEDVIEAIHLAFQAWEQASNYTVSFIYDGTTEIAAAEPIDGNVVYWINSSWPHPSNRMANTKTHVDPTGKIVGADLQFNGEHFSWSTSAVGESGKKDVQNVATHEAGHIIGIGHSDVSEAAMWPLIPDAEITKRSLEDDDIEAVSFIFPETPVDISIVSGDNQEGPPGTVLPEPLRIRVTEGGVPVAGARLIYDIFSGGGTLGGGRLA